MVAEIIGWKQMGAELAPGLDALTEKIIGAAFAVSDGLGHGFLEKIYRNAMAEEMAFRQIQFMIEKEYSIFYRGKMTGRYVSDMVVEDRVIVELKAIEGLSPVHSAQLLNYLKVSRVPVGLLLNFGRPRLEMKRILLPKSVAVR